MKKLLGCLLALILLSPVSVLAIQSLGVAPGAPGSGGIYFGPEPSSDSYQWVFADTFVGGVDGFAIPDSGGDLSIWYGSDSGSVDKDKDIWLATTAATGDDFTFAGGVFNSNDNLAVACYKAPVYGLYLGTIKNPVLGLTWDILNVGEFGTGNKEFYVLTGAIEYSDFEVGDWMYSATTGSGVDAFSSPTTSTTVPAPATIVLLGTGLIGLVGLGRKKSFKLN